MQINRSSKPIYALTPFTMLDYPDKLACILWFQGCNLRCAYCYNTEIVTGIGNLDFLSVLEFLDTRVGLLDAVVLSGGEATLCQGLENLAFLIKQKGFLIKLDTNGTRADKLKSMIQAKLLDYVALDFKAPPYKDLAITQYADTYRCFLEALEVLQTSQIPFEIRTTAHSELLNPKDLEVMCEILCARGYQGKYYLQDFIGDKKTFVPLGKSYNKKQNRAHGPIELIWR
ncbi:anaerobic ribonucleoside-triphosphate reductase activating protein [Helicobacter sp. 12S02634-8]|uniref:anaerobic ribonucleoside-triphosphate reductase activating protein n=1 Tax=Helicobacter sp. 12S02634-8 TaxID=1476199 RepID=UPI000BA57EB6|nr:anaerobic ribonucleoside-triphosphate reductase activating protein [Helicobacter sp. 12S02634-8]PAF48473.1 anaerobic ribonucleoside-triphosphate reductase activating protein [Helicobacter sp. 12S02634-8]